MVSCLRAGLLSAGLATVVLASAASHADEGDRDALRHAVQRGEIRSLAEILKVVRDKLPGKVAGVEVEREDGRWLYEFRVVDPNGRLFEVYVDARSAAIEKVKEK